MAFDAGAVTIKIIFDDSQYTDGMNRAGKSNQNLTKSMFLANAAYDAFKKVLSGTINTVKQSIVLATDFAEANSKLMTVFKGVQSEANNMTKTLVRDFGLSKKAATELLGGTGDLLTGFGFTQQKALDLSGQVQKLAVDLASFTNFSGGAEGASAALTKALLGERESVKSLGISIQEADVQARLAAEGKDKLTGAALRQAKAEVTLQIAMEQSKNAIGDYARTQDSFANRQRQLQAVTEDLQVQIGSVFVPILNEFAGATLKSARGLRDFLSSAQGINLLSDIFASLFSSITLVKDIFIDLGTNIFGTFKGEIDDIFDSFSELTGEFKGSISVFDILGGAVKILNIGFSVAIKLIKIQVQAWIDWINVLKNAGQALFAIFQALTDPTKWGEAKNQMSEVKTAFGNMTENIIDNTEDIVKTVVDGFKTFPDEAQSNAKKYESIWNESYKRNKSNFLKQQQETLNAQNQIIPISTGNAQKMSDIWKEKMKQTSDNMQKAWDNIGSKITEKASYILGVISDTFNSISGVITDQLNYELSVIENKNEEELKKLEKQKEDKLENIENEFEQQNEILQEQRDNELISQEEYDAQKTILEQNKANQTEAIEKELDAKIAAQKKKGIEKENAQKKRIFEAEKANKIANIWLQYAIGLVGIWAQSIAQLGPIAGSILAGIMTGVLTGVAVAQTVLVGQQQFIPQKATGGMASGVTRINEQGGEIVNLPDNSLVIPNDISRQIASNSGNMKTVNINMAGAFNGAVISNNMSLEKITNHVINKMTQQLRLQS